MKELSETDYVIYDWANDHVISFENGDIINIKVPQGNIGINVKNQDKNDKFLSGNYIARDVIHHFNRVGYNTQINCIRSGSKDQMHEP